MLPDWDTLLKDFEALEDWQARYEYVIDLGRQLPAMAEGDKNLQYKVAGCLSQVWLKAELINGKLHFNADSDSSIVKGLIGILMILYQDCSPADALAVDMPARFTELGMEEHLSPNRRNGFFAMVDKIKMYAEKFA